MDPCVLCGRACDREKGSVIVLRCGRCGDCSLHEECHADYMHKVKRCRESRQGKAAKVGFSCPRAKCGGIVRSTSVLHKTTPAPLAEPKKKTKKKLPALNTRGSTGPSKEMWHNPAAPATSDPARPTTRKLTVHPEPQSESEESQDDHDKFVQSLIEILLSP